VSATKASEEFGPLLGPKATNSTGLCDIGFLHDAPCFHVADIWKCAHEIKGPHLGYAVFFLGQREELLEREIARFHHLLDVRSTPPVRDGETGGRNTLFLR
jgi:hypothetical protein